MLKQFLVISYDISDDRRRVKIAKTLEDYGTRVQYSVFECRLLPPELERLKRLLKTYLRESQDSIRIYFVAADDVGRIQILGGGKVTQDAQYFLH